MWFLAGFVLSWVYANLGHWAFILSRLQGKASLLDVKVIGSILGLDQH
jgi:hypothetical protein